MRTEQTAVLIIGAGPSSSVSAGPLRKRGRKVLIIERDRFPCFSFDERLFPQSMQHLEEPDFLRDLVETDHAWNTSNPCVATLSRLAALEGSCRA